MSPEAVDDHVVNANADKRFFISMLVKDIELVPAIVDLVDNSVDAAHARVADEGLAISTMSVRLDVGPERFLIVDNCGGMNADDARHYAFRFGRPEDFEGIESSVGQFGIGMKRALFKLGDHFRITSVSATSRFSMSVDVGTWADDPDPDWTFRFDEVDDSAGGPPEERGVEIEVDHLHPNVSDDFARDTVIGQLRRDISMKHQPVLADGIEIVVNGDKLSALHPTLLASKELRPIRHKLNIPADSDGVEAEFFAGLAAPSGRKDFTVDEADAAQFTETGPAGWYIYCNDRLVLAADKTPLTGWGAGRPVYHPQYRRFRGYVYLRARKSELLPWNTTKTGLDQDSPIFRVVQQEMVRILEHVQAVINAAKEERAANEEGDRPLNKAIDDAENTDVFKLGSSRVFAVPTTKPKLRRSQSNTVTVQYRVRREEMERVMELLDVDSATKAGLETFQYFVANELE